MSSLSSRTRRQQRFWSKVEPSGSCWLWTGATDRDGYGKWHLNGKNVSAHRAVWMLVYGYVPRGHVLHSCDTPACVRPLHLREGSSLDNVRDMQARGRYSKGTDRWNARLDENTVRLLRRLYSEGASARGLAKAYGVSDFAVRAVISGRTWRHVH